MVQVVTCSISSVENVVLSRWLFPMEEGMEGSEGAKLLRLIIQAPKGRWQDGIKIGMIDMEPGQVPGIFKSKEACPSRVV